MSVLPILVPEPNGMNVHTRFGIVRQSPHHAVGAAHAAAVSFWASYGYGATRSQLQAWAWVHISLLSHIRRRAEGHKDQEEWTKPTAGWDSTIRSRTRIDPSSVPVPVRSLVGFAEDGIDAMDMIYDTTDYYAGHFGRSSAATSNPGEPTRDER